MAAAYEVTSVQENQIEDASGDLQDAFDITFVIPGRPGSFLVEVLQAGDVVGAAQAAIDAKVAEVAGIYAL